MGVPQILFSGDGVPVSAHCWNADRSKVAVSLNNSEVVIMDTASAKKSGRGNLQPNANDILTEHDMRVTSIDWAPNSGLIVTCGEDRNAYVWQQAGGGQPWKPCLVVLRINRAATAVKWSPHENKFAVASGANCISVCYFEKENDWWLAKHVKKNIKSTVTCLDWHPNNNLLAAGTARFAVNVFAAQVEEVGDKFDPNSPWYSKKPKFGDNLAGFRHLKMGWIHDVAFNGDGTMLAWVSHSSTLSVMNGLNNQEVFHYKMSELPLLSCLWIAPDTVMAAGHGCTPLWFDIDPMSGKVKSHGRLEREEKGPKTSTSSINAMKMFRDRDRLGVSGDGDGSGMGGGNGGGGGMEVPNTAHVKQINTLRFFDSETVSSSADDGKIVLWKNSLDAKMRGLSV